MQAIPSLDFVPQNEKSSIVKFGQMIQKSWRNLTTLINGSLGFGDGTKPDNISGAWVNVVAPASPNTDFTVTHNLGRLPVGYWLMEKDRACDLYTGSVPATTSQITFRATAASAVLRIFVICLLFSMVSIITNAQTTVNLTVQDTNGAFWTGPWSVSLRSPAGSSTNFSLLCGGGSLGSQSGSLTSGGTVTISLPANSCIAPSGTSWNFNVCFSSTGICYTQLVTVSSSSPQNLLLTPPPGSNPSSGSGSGSQTPGVFNSNFDPPLLQNYTITSTGTQSSINLTANPIDTHVMSWRTSLSGIPSYGSDGFNYSNGDLHTQNANWIYTGGSLTVSNGVVYSSSASLSVAYLSTGLNASSEFASVTVSLQAGLNSQQTGPCVALQTSSVSGYCLQVAADTMIIQRFSSGSATALTTCTLAPSNATLALGKVGSTLTVYLNGVPVPGCTATDATFASGFVGIYGAVNATLNGLFDFQFGAAYPSCNVQIDSSRDGVNWISGGLIPNQSCVVGSFANTTQTANFLRVNTTSLTSGLTLTVQYSGRLAPSATVLGSAPVSNGQYVQPGDVIWVQYTTIGIGARNIYSQARILLGNKQVQQTSWTVSCGFGASGGFGTGFMVTQPGILQAITTYDTGGAEPQGSELINLYILNSMPSGGSTTSCVNTLTTPAIGNILGTWVSGSFLPVSFVGTTSTFASAWSIPGYTLPLTITAPGAGNEFSFTFPTQARTCVQSVSFTLAAGSTNVTPAIVFTINGSKLVYTAVTAQTSGTTITYSFSPGATAETVTAGATTFHIVPFNNGQMICTNSGLTTATLASVTAGLNSTTTYTNGSILVQNQNDGN